VEVVGARGRRADVALVERLGDRIARGGEPGRDSSVQRRLRRIGGIAAASARGGKEDQGQEERATAQTVPFLSY
jgi:hypothetical protein